MSRRIVIIQGHPDAHQARFVRVLADTYAKNAVKAEHDVKVIDVANLDFSLLRSKQEWESGAPPEPIRVAQQTIAWAEHLVIFFPLWLGTMPALLKAFLEQVFRPGFAIEKVEGEKTWKKRLVGKSARIVVTMGMPAFIYRWYFRAHGLKSLERNILGFCGIGPIKETLIGLIESSEVSRREKALAKMRVLGREGR